MSLDKIKQLVGNLNKRIEENQEVALPILVSKANKYTQQYPEDKTIGALGVIFEKLASNNKFFIKKAELRNLYAKHYSYNTRFASLFADEMGETEEVSSVTFKESDQGLSQSYKVDSVLSNALNSIFDNTVEFKEYSDKIAAVAINFVRSDLNSLNLKPASINVDAGNDKVLILKANYETPKGITSFYVPLSVSDNKVSQASSFIGSSGLEDLNYNNIRNYIVKSAGSKLNVRGLDILNLLTSETKEISQAEMALIRVNAKKEQQLDFASNSILGEKLATASVKDVVLPKNKEAELFSTRFASVDGDAEYKFGGNVKIAKDYILRELSSLGYKNSQIKLTKTSGSTMYYGVSVNGLAFTIPVKVANDKINRPEVVLSNGKIASFDAAGLSSLATDYSVSAKVSPSYGLTPGALIAEIKKAVASKNMAKAEDCLNVLENTGTASEYALGLKAFVVSSGSNDIKETSCSMIVRNSSSNKGICGHTGLTVDKVFQDKHGNCQPLYRQGMDETYDVATFMNAKILG